MMQLNEDVTLKIATHLDLSTILSLSRVSAHVACSWDSEAELTSRIVPLDVSKLVSAQPLVSVVLDQCSRRTSIPGPYFDHS